MGGLLGGRKRNQEPAEHDPTNELLHEASPKRKFVRVMTGLKSVHRESGFVHGVWDEHGKITGSATLKDASRRAKPDRTASGRSGNPAFKGRSCRPAQTRSGDRRETGWNSGLTRKSQDRRKSGRSRPSQIRERDF